MQAVNKGNLDLGALGDTQDKAVQEKNEKDFSDITKKVQDILNNKVKEVRLTHRLTDSPACLVVDENDLSAQMQRILQSAGQNVPESKPNLELNPEHPLVSTLKNQKVMLSFACAF